LDALLVFVEVIESREELWGLEVSHKRVLIAVLNQWQTILIQSESKIFNGLARAKKLDGPRIFCAMAFVIKVIGVRVKGRHTLSADVPR
jgi:hypothetical protein